LPVGEHQDVEGVSLDDGESESQRLIAIAELVDADENRRRIVEVGCVALERLGRSLSGH